MTASIRLAAASNGSVNNPASVSMALLATDYLVVQLAVKDGSDPAIALVVPTVGGVSMTALGSEYTGTGGARRFTRLYGYTPPADGTYTVSGSISQNFYFKGMQAFAWQGATASPISGIVGASSSGTDQTWTVTSAVGDVVAAHITSQNTNTVTAGSGSTLVSGSGLGAGQYETGLTEAGAASVTINGTTASATDSWGLAYSVASAAAAPTLTGDFTLADLVLSGTFATGALSQLAGGITLDDFLNGGVLGLAPGIVATEPFKNWSGTLLPGVTVPNVVFLKLDRTLPLALVNQVTAGDGVMTVANAALVAGTFYIMVTFDATGASIGAELVQAT